MAEAPPPQPPPGTHMQGCHSNQDRPKEDERKESLKRERGQASLGRTQQTGQTNRAGDPRHVAAEAAARGDKGRICSKSSRWGRDKILWLRNRQGGGGGPGTWTQSRPSGSTLGLGGVWGLQPSSPHLQLWVPRGPAVLCMHQACLFADRVDAGRKAAETRAPCEGSNVCPEQCLILLPLASARLHSMQKLPWGTLWRLKRWHLGLLQPHQHLPAGLANLCRLLHWLALVSLRTLCAAPAL